MPNEIPSASQLLQDAEATTGLSDWGGEAYAEPAFRALLEAMVPALNEHAALTERGYRGAEARLRAALEMRLRVIEDRKQRPELAVTPIERPIFIMGLPRTGSSFLQDLLAQDPAVHAPLVWEMMLPSPPPRPADRVDDPRIARAGAIFDDIGLTDPILMELHPFDVRTADEDHSMMEMTLLGDQFMASWRMPAYIRQRGQTDPVLPFRAHRWVLENLHSEHRGKQVVLKNPGHFLHMANLLAVYPDARFVMTHRDPARTIPSVGRLVVELRAAPSTERPPLDKITRGNMNAFAQGLEAFIDQRESGEITSPILDIHFREMIADPIATVERIYGTFGMELSAEARTAMETWLARDNAHASKVRHDLASCGLTFADIDAAFGKYIAYFGIPLERG